MSIRDKQKNEKDELLKSAKNLEIYKTVINKFPDAELIEVKLNNKED